MSGLICFAVREEAKPFLQKLCPTDADQVIVTGMGAKNAASALIRELDNRSQKPNFIISCGFAGGLSPELATGSVIYSADEGFLLLPKLQSSSAKSAEIRSTDRVLITVEEKAAFRETNGADAVEMESDTIRRIAAERGIPSATIRVISDAWNEPMPIDFNRFIGPDDNLQLPRLIAHILTHPTVIPAMLRFQKQTTAAGGALAQTLTHILQITP